MRTVLKSATFLATESVNSAPFKRGETEVQFFWQGKAQNYSPILRCTFLARRSTKLTANLMVTSLPSFSLSLSLCISLSHRMYLTHNIGSASALPIIQTERERDGSDVTIVVLKLAMGLHFPLPKIRTFQSSLPTSHLTLLKRSPLWR